MRRFAEHLQKYKEEQGEKKMEKRVTKDDLKADEQLVPFGLADRCYSSDTEDCSKAQRHIETSHCAIREYVDMSLTPELEGAVTACLFRLRQLKMQDIGIGHKTRRYAVGFREVRVLEVGVQSGGSIQMWESVLGGGCVVHGIDINQACLQFRNIACKAMRAYFNRRCNL